MSIKVKTKPRIKIPEIGDKVKIAIKPYKGKTEIGIVKRVLTKKKYHSRGHKVMLDSGTVGRIVKIIKIKTKRKTKGKITRKITGKTTCKTKKKCKNCGNTL